MRSRLNPAYAFTLGFFALGLVAACGGSDDPVEPEPPQPTVLRVIVHSEADSSVVEGSNVVLYRAETREAVARGLTNADGVIDFEPDMGNYYTTISAQGFAATPPENITPVPFFVALEDTTTRQVMLDPLTGVADAGYVIGYVDPAIDNVLIVSDLKSTTSSYSTSSGPDGVFVLFNLPAGDYTLDALKAGYLKTEAVDFTILSSAAADTVRVPMAEYAGSTLNGSVTFLASENSVVDITLLDRQTAAVVPGLAVMSTPEGLNYSISSIPDGDYLAWASLRNDGYVLDPNWLFKNPNGLDVEFFSSTTTALNFSVTDAISLVGPTNPSDTTTPAVADSTVPTFSWLPYPSTKEYFIEVRDVDGTLLWGGFDADGVAGHGFIPASQTSVQYNFDAQPGVPDLRPGEIYQWRLWADKGTQLDGVVEELISSTEDLLGLFTIPEPAPVE